MPGGTRREIPTEFFRHININEKSLDYNLNLRTKFSELFKFYIDGFYYDPYTTSKISSNKYLDTETKRKIDSKVKEIERNRRSDILSKLLSLY